MVSGWSWSPSQRDDVGDGCGDRGTGGFRGRKQRDDGDLLLAVRTVPGRGRLQRVAFQDWLAWVGCPGSERGFLLAAGAATRTEEGESRAGGRTACRSERGRTSSAIRRPRVSVMNARRAVMHPTMDRGRRPTDRSTQRAGLPDRSRVAATRAADAIHHHLQP